MIWWIVGMVVCWFAGGFCGHLWVKDYYEPRAAGWERNYRACEECRKSDEKTYLKTIDRQKEQIQSLEKRLEIVARLAGGKP